LFRAFAQLLLVKRPDLNRSELSRRLLVRLSHQRCPYHERTLRRQLSGAVATVPRVVEAEMSALLIDSTDVGSAARARAAVIEAGIFDPAEPRDNDRVPIESVTLLVHLLLHLNPGRTRRSLAHGLKSDLAACGIEISSGYLETIIGGRVGSARREVVGALLDRLREHGITSMDDARRFSREVKGEIHRSMTGRELVPASRFGRLARAWQWQHRGASKRQLAALLRTRLTERGVSCSFTYLQRLLSGVGGSGRRRVYEVLKNVVRESLPAGVGLEDARRRVEPGRVAESDVEWVRAEPIAATAKRWLEEHPGVSKRRLALRIVRTVHKLGYSTTLNTVQTVLAGKTTRTRGYVYRAMLKQLDDGGRPRIPAGDLLHSEVSRGLAADERSRWLRRSGVIQRSTPSASDLDLVSMLRREVSSLPLPSYEHEIQVHQRIMDGERVVLAAVLDTAMGRALVADLAGRLRRGEIGRRELVPGRGYDGAEDSTTQERRLMWLEEFSKLARCCARLQAGIDVDEDAIRRDFVRLHDRSSFLFDSLRPAAERLKTVLHRLESGEIDPAAAERDVEMRVAGLRRVCGEILRGEREAKYARAELVEGNLRHVLALARRHANRSLPLLDLVQEGCIGLMRAAERFEVQRGYRFSTYARWWIRQAMARTIANQGRTVRIPVHSLERMHKINRTRWKLSQQLGREPMLDEVADELGLPIGDIHELSLASRRVISLQEPRGGENETVTLIDTIEHSIAPPPTETVDGIDMAQALHQAVATLNPRERRIICMRFGIDGEAEHTLAEIGDEIGVSRERIRQIQARALGKLRNKAAIRSFENLLRN